MDDGAQFLENIKDSGGVLAASARNGREMPRCFIEHDIGRKERCTFAIPFDQVADASTQDRANEDVRIEHDPSGGHALRFAS